jgi:GT2 family glycosyltransferase
MSYLSHQRNADQAASRTDAGRPRVEGKFLRFAGEKFWVRGVSYGTFRPHPGGHDYPEAGVVEDDCAAMAAHGINVMRTYTVPPRWLLDAAHRHGLFVLVGLPWEQHITFLDERGRSQAIEQRMRDDVRACVGHPAILGYTVGNEIPAPIVRWHGRRRVERFIERLYHVVKAEDPEALVTYVNYPTTEYLELPFLDLVCFNVYLESQDALDGYLARLHNLAGERPLVLTEFGLDSRRHGEAFQASTLDWQVRAAFAGGCAGAVIFSWTDEWYRGGFAIDDWDFGLTRRDRSPKPALAAVRDAFQEVPFPKDVPRPRISVVVCSYNGERTIRDCLEGLLRIDYPDFEVIVVDDGSTDRTALLAHEYGFRVISTPNRGLSSARNTGLAAATGDIVAYIDDDAFPEQHWLTYLAHTFATTSHAGVGGPNIAPPGDGPIAASVANAPGGPIHVLLSDREAEHIPGCNMAYRRDRLLAIGGFDVQFRTAGDDVDVCWRLQQAGWTLGFNPAAMVWHHRRNSVRTYWRQQVGYGRAEALLERKWPDKYNGAGHLAWAGRLYGKGLTAMLHPRRGRIYQGTWGTAPFQSLYERTPTTFESLPLMPEWYLVVALLTVVCALGVAWRPLLATAPLLAVALGAPILHAAISARRARPPAEMVGSRRAALRFHAVTALLHLMQPLARLTGRLRHGLTPWRRRPVSGHAWPWRRRAAIWSERWQAPEDRLAALLSTLRAAGADVVLGDAFDGWDLEVRGGLLAASRVLLVAEEHGAGKQLVRFRIWPRWSRVGVAVTMLFGLLAAGAALDHAWAACTMLAGIAALLAARTAHESSAATAAMLHAVRTSAAGR